MPVSSIPTCVALVYLMHRKIEDDCGQNAHLPLQGGRKHNKMQRKRSKKSMQLRKTIEAHDFLLNCCTKFQDSTDTVALIPC